MNKLFTLILLILCFTFPANAQETNPFTSNPTNSEEVKQVSATFEKDKVVQYKTYKITSVDKKSKRKDALTIYTPLFGKTTNTDTKGFEAVIVNNRVIKLNQNNSYIPANGYVISGHGKAKKFITNNFFEGADISIDFKKNIFKIVAHPDNYLYAAIYKRDKMQELLSTIDNPKIDTNNMTFFINRSTEIIERTKKLIQFEDFENAQKMSEDSMKYSDKALYYSLAYNPDETKGIYVFPYQKNEKQIYEAMDMAKRLNVDTIILEVYYNGLTIYPSIVNKNYGMPEQNRYYKNFDVLSQWIKIAKGNNIKLYVALDTINVGNPPKSTIKKNIVRVHRDWLSKTSKKNNYVLDLKNDNVQQYFVDIIEELFSNYDIAGVNLQGFQYEREKFGIDSFENKLFDLTNKNEKISIGINVYPEKTDISNWKFNNNIYLIPVLSSSDNDFARDFLSGIKTKNETVKICPIYMTPYLEEKPAMLFEQVTTARKLNISGIILYSLDYIDKEYHDALRCSLFREPRSKKQNVLYEK